MFRNVFFFVKNMQHKDENVLFFIGKLHGWAFSLVCIIHHFPVFDIVCQCFDFDSNSDSDYELADLLHAVIDSQLNA